MFLNSFLQKVFQGFENYHIERGEDAKFQIILQKMEVDLVCGCFTNTVVAYLIGFDRTQYIYSGGCKENPV